MERRNETSDGCKKVHADATYISFLVPEAPLVLAANASLSHIGAGLTQLVEGIWEPLGFFSRKLSEAEKKYSPYDRELLVVF